MSGPKPRCEEGAEKVAEPAHPPTHLGLTEATGSQRWAPSRPEGHEERGGARDKRMQGDWSPLKDH